MVGRSIYWSWILLVWAIAITTLPSSAMAQTQTQSCSIAMSPTAPVIRVNDTSGTSSSSDPSVKLTITRKDCLNDKLRFRFSMTVAGYQTTMAFEAWAGRSASDCAGEYAGITSTKTCWKLGTLNVKNSVATVEFSAADLLGVNANAGDAPNAKIILDTCEDMTNKDRGRQSFTVTFLLISSSAVSCSQKQGMFYSLTGPDGPPSISAYPSDSALRVEWPSINANLTTDVVYEFYCAPDESNGQCHSSILESLGSTRQSRSDDDVGAAGSSSSTGTGGADSTTDTGQSGGGGTTSVGGAGSVGEAGTSGTGDGVGGDGALAGSGGAAGSTGSAGSTGEGAAAGDAAGGSAGEGPQASATTFSKQLCGTVRGRINTSGYTDPKLLPMENKWSYAVAVGVRDVYGNLGSLSPYACATPQEIDTFFEAYRDAGGKAGGGFCNLNVQPKHGTLPAALGALGLLAWLRRRRNARRNVDATHSIH